MSLEILKAAALLIEECRDLIVWSVPDSVTAKPLLLDKIDKFDHAVSSEIFGEYKKEE